MFFSAGFGDFCRRLRFIALLSAGIFAQGARAADGKLMPSAADIVRRSVEVNNRDWQAQTRFDFLRDDVKGRHELVNKTKDHECKTYQVVVIDASPYDRLIAINNQPLNEKQQRQEEEKMTREALRRQREGQSERHSRLNKYENERSEEHLLMQQMADAFNFSVEGEEEVSGTRCFVLNAEPRSDYHAPVEKARVLAGMRGRMWIDKEHYHWVRVEAEVSKPVDFGLVIARVKPGTRFELQQMDVGGVWLPKSFNQTVNVSVLGLYGLQSREETYFSNYRQTQVSAAR